MPSLIDVGYWSWNSAYGIYKAEEENRQGNPWASLEGLLNADTILAFDSVSSIRKDHLPWYKSSRHELPELAQKLQKIAFSLENELMRRYPSNVRTEPGLEADDVIAIYAKPGDIIWSNDKDYLQLDERIMLTNFRNEFWGTERFKAPEGVKIERGAGALAWQLLYGDVADDIPRRYYGGDKELIRWIFSQPNPLNEAVKLVPPQQLKTSLVALVLPTPLWTPEKHIIGSVLERYS